MLPFNVIERVNIMRRTDQRLKEMMRCTNYCAHFSTCNLRFIYVDTGVYNGRRSDTHGRKG